MYTIYSIKVVLPNQIEVLNPTKDSTITLVTCTPIRIATHRLIIKAKEKSSL
ncbi:sortase [Clostridium tyrobutyricum]|uniref:sortase n=1 Tax=Clostridium tyrobutyricum TaxID=1519 RepID=UPI003F62B2B6